MIEAFEILVQDHSARIAHKELLVVVSKDLAFEVIGAYVRGGFQV